MMYDVLFTMYDLVLRRGWANLRQAEHAEVCEVSRGACAVGAGFAAMDGVGVGFAGCGEVGVHADAPSFGVRDEVSFHPCRGAEIIGGLVFGVVPVGLPWSGIEGGKGGFCPALGDAVDGTRWHAGGGAFDRHEVGFGGGVREPVRAIEPCIAIDFDEGGLLFGLHDGRKVFKLLPHEGESVEGAVARGGVCLQDFAPVRDLGARDGVFGIVGKDDGGIGIQCADAPCTEGEEAGVLGACVDVVEHRGIYDVLCTMYNFLRKPWQSQGEFSNRYMVHCTLCVCYSASAVSTLKTR